MICKEIFHRIDEMQDIYLDFLEDVANIESPTNYKEGVDNASGYFIEKAKEHGWKVEIFKQKVSGDVVCITMNPEATGNPISLSGHMDTVHPVGSFGTPAVRRDNVNMYGPGVTDCKGGPVAGFLAMDVLEQFGYKGRPIQLLLQSDEENGSKTSGGETIRWICEKAKNSVAFLNLEGSAGNTVVLQRKGILRYKFIVHGKAEHSAKCVYGANPIADAAYKILELEKMKDAEGLTCNCGVIHAGTVANSVPDTCEFLADIRFSTEQEFIHVQKKVKELIQTSYIEGCSCEVEQLSYRPPMKKSEKNMQLYEKINRIYAENNLPILEWRKTEGGSDAAYVTEYGIPCVDCLGLEGSKIHSLKEYMQMKSMAETAKRIASVIYCF